MKSQGPAAPDVLRDFYNRSAGSYEGTRLKASHQLRFDATERKIIRRHLQGSGHILEVGAGTGRLTVELLRHSGRVTAVDISENMLAEIGRKFPGERRLQLHRQDVYELESLPGYGCYDALLSLRMLPHIEDITRVLHLFGGAVVPGGLVVTDFWNRNSYTYLRKRSARVYNHFVTYKEALGLIGAAGLELVALEGAGFRSPLDIDLEFLGRTPLKRIAYSLVAVCRRPFMG